MKTTRRRFSSTDKPTKFRFTAARCRLRKSPPFTYAQVAGKAKIDQTTTADPTAQIGDATVTFGGVTADGATTQTGIDLGLLPRLPATLTFTGLAYDVSTTATATAPRVCFNVPTLAAQFNQLRIVHLETNSSGVRRWIDRTDTSSTSPNLCTNGLPSLSPFAIVTGQVPTAAAVTVGGRVLSANGRGIRNVRIAMTDSSGRTRTATTGAFGYYSFANVPAGGTYIFEARAKQYVFANPVQVLSINADSSDVDFYAEQ